MLFLLEVPCQSAAKPSHLDDCCSLFGFQRGCHFCQEIFPGPLSSGWKVKVAQSCPTNSLQPHGLHSPWNSPGQNTGVGSHPLLQGIFPTQGLNLGLPHCTWILYHLSHQGSPRILEWVAYAFSSGSSQPRNRTRVSCITDGFFTHWVTREQKLVVTPPLFFLRLLCAACRILVPWPGIQPGPPVVEAWSPNHWTAREFSSCPSYVWLYLFYHRPYQHCTVSTSFSGSFYYMVSSPRAAILSVLFNLSGPF